MYKNCFYDKIIAMRKKRTQPKNAQKLVFVCCCWIFNGLPLFILHIFHPLITLRKILIRNKIKLFAGQLIISILSATWHRYETLILSLAHNAVSHLAVSKQQQQQKTINNNNNK